jgi:hypothetical protein
LSVSQLSSKLPLGAPTLRDDVQLL